MSNKRIISTSVVIDLGETDIRQVKSALSGRILHDECFTRPMYDIPENFKLSVRVRVVTPKGYKKTVRVLKTAKRLGLGDVIFDSFGDEVYHPMYVVIS